MTTYNAGFEIRCTSHVAYPAVGRKGSHTTSRDPCEGQLQSLAATTQERDTYPAKDKDKYLIGKAL